MNQGMRLYLLIMLVITGVVIGMLLTIVVTRAEAQEIAQQSVTVTIPIDTVVKGDPGYTEIVATLTPADLDAEPGWICNLVGFGDNGESTHPDTNAIVSSNGDVVIIPDWERAANTRTAATNGTLTLGTTVTIAIQVGPHKIASGGLEIQFTCNPPGQQTTTTTSSVPESTTTTTQATTPAPSTTVPSVTPTTLSEPPVGGVPAGFGSCADGACDDLSPVATWIWIAILLPAGGLLVWAYFRYVMAPGEEA